MNPPEVEFRGTISKFRDRSKISLLLVYVLHKTWNRVFSRRSRAKTGKEMYKKAWCCWSCCFSYKTFFFFFLRSRRRPRRWILKSLLQVGEIMSNNEIIIFLLLLEIEWVKSRRENDLISRWNLPWLQYCVMLLEKCIMGYYSIVVCSNPSAH